MDHQDLVDPELRQRAIANLLKSSADTEGFEPSRLIHLALLSLGVAILVNDHAQPRTRARDADVRHPPIPIVVDIGKSGEDDDVVF